MSEQTTPHRITADEVRVGQRVHAECVHEERYGSVTQTADDGIWVRENFFPFCDTFTVTLLSDAPAEDRPYADLGMQSREDIETHMHELIQRAERAESELEENTGVMKALRRQRDEAEAKLAEVRDWSYHYLGTEGGKELRRIVDGEDA